MVVFAKRGKTGGGACLGRENQEFCLGRVKSKISFPINHHQMETSS